MIVISHLPSRNRFKNPRFKRRARRLTTLKKEGKLRKEELFQVQHIEATENNASPPPMRAASFGKEGRLEVIR